MKKIKEAASEFLANKRVILATGTVAGYLFGRHDFDLTIPDARTVAVSILLIRGLYLVLALEAEGARRRSALVSPMCAALAGAYVGCLLLPATRRFFALTVPDLGMIATTLVASALTIGALLVCGLTPAARRPIPDIEP
jgi:hypothetical protein